MSLTEIYKEHLYTVDDVIEDNGKYHLIATFPSLNETHAFSEDCPRKLVNYVNEMVLRDIEIESAIAPYRNAVRELSTLCLTQDGSGARAAAQVLLSAFNSHGYQLGIIDLCNLDASNFKFAMDLIKGRVVTKEEPQNMIEDGDDIFDKLRERWSHLAVDERYKDWYQD